MRTLVISDLHLGVRTGADVLGQPQALDILCSRLDGVDRLVLLGDTLELRHGPARDALAAAEPVMRAIGDALGPDSARSRSSPATTTTRSSPAGWTGAGAARSRRRWRSTSASRRSTRRGSPSAWRAGSRRRRVEIAYPGVWLRDDVYAMHGHYLDVHCEIPTLEVLGGRAMRRMVGAVPQRADAGGLRGAAGADLRVDPRQRPAHVAAPARGRRRHGASRSGTRSRARARGARRRRAALRGRLSRARCWPPTAPASGPVRPELSGVALRRAGLAGLARSRAGSQLAPAHLLFGHTHRTGMLAGDEAGEWRTPARTRLHNSGCWVFETHFMGTRRARRRTPTGPAARSRIDDDGPPRLERLLSDLPGQRSSARERRA